MEPRSCQLVFITLLDRFTWPTTGSYQAVKSSRCTQQEPNWTKQCHRQSASLRAPEESWQPTLLAPSTFYLVYHPWSRCHYWIQVETPSTDITPLQDTKNSWKNGLVDSMSDPRGQHSNPVSHRPVVTKRKYSKCFKRKVNFGWIHLQLLRSGIAYISWHLLSVAVYHCSQCGGCVD